ncbi:MAG TPA: histidine kinase [Saprospiraceae bacterium]|nr:histidine kinase [Saprospiraceae bacterium]
MVNSTRNAPPHDYWPNMEGYSMHLLFFCAALGAFVVTALFHFSIYLQQKDKAFLTYSVYLSIYACFILIRILDERLTDIWPLSYTTVYHGDEILAKLTLIAYVNFMGALFVTPDMRLHVIGWRILQWFTYSYCILYLILVAAGTSIVILEQLSFVSSIVLLSLGFFLIVKVFRFYKNPFYQLIIIGSLFVTFSVTSGVVYNIVTGSEKLSITAYTLMLSGAIPEIIFLSSALGYRLRTAYKERSQAQQELILQLQRNEQLANSLNEELEQKVIERTAEIKVKSDMLEKEKEQKLTAEFDKQIAEAQLTALNAQMNPHFIFNCMNSIQKYILKNEKAKALDFLQHFSELMRSVLDSSTKTRITLDEEISMLEKYILLEQQRLDHKFDYSISIAKDLQTDFFEVPGMIIQPYIENAIWHGLMNMPDKGKLMLSFEKENGSIRCVVEDNGVGRKRAAEIGEQNSIKRKSYGMTISQRRMELLQKENLDIPEIRIEDLGHNGHAGSGTRVTIHFQVD